LSWSMVVMKPEYSIANYDHHDYVHTDSCIISVT
jgi:hypothetical protein